MERTTDIKELRNKNARFTWGTITNVQEIGRYCIVEYHPWKVKGIEVLVGDRDENTLEYHCYVDDRDTCQSVDSLDAALVACIAYKHEGANHRADSYFMKMIEEK